MKWRLLYFKILEEVVFFKSWLIFYRFGLKASLMRASMMSTFFEHVVRYVPRFLKKLLLKCMNTISIGWNVLLMENLSRFLTL